MDRTQHYREGGWGWLVVLANFLSEVIVYGSLKGFGVLIIAMKDYFDVDLWVIGSIGSLHFGVQFVLTPVASALARKVGSRRVFIAGGILYGLGLVLSTTTDHVAVLAASFVVLAGSGAACAIVISRSEIAFYFQKKFALASFLALTGAPVGMMVYGPVTQFLLTTYGWRGAMLLLGGLGFNLVWAGLLARRPTGVYKALSCEDSQHEESKSKHKRESFAGAVGLDILMNFNFILVAGVRMLYNVGYGGVIIYLVPNGLSLGLSTDQASLLTVAYGLGSIGGLLLGALALHTEVFSRHATAAVSGGVTVLAYALQPIVPTFIGQMGNAFVVGLGVNCVVEVVSVLERQLFFEDDKFVIVLGWISFLSGLASSAGDVTSGWLYDVTGSFYGTFLLYSVTMVASMLCLLVHYLRNSVR